MQKNESSISLPWGQIDTVLLDMDGTLLDLHFDNHFWLEYLPFHYSKKHSISLDESKKQLEKLSSEVKGTLNWYCLDYWQDKLEIDIVKLKEDTDDKIDFRPNVINFLDYLKSKNKRIILATNAHPKAIELKLLRADFSEYFAELSSSHDLGYPKEERKYWEILIKQYQIDPKRSLFIDDSLSVLDAASEFGIAYVLGISTPDSQKPAINCSPYTSIHDFTQLIC